MRDAIERSRPTGNAPRAQRGAMRPALVALVLAVSVAAAAAGVRLGLMVQSQPQTTAITLYPQPRALAGFELVDAGGDRFGIDRWRGEWRLVFFGFTHCPDICPSTLAMLRGVIRELEPGPMPVVTLVSVDPERDTPEQLGEYAAYFDPRFEAATGEPAQLTALTRQMGVVYHIEAHDEGVADYAVDHSSAILLVDPEARLRGAFLAPHDPQALVADLRALLDDA